jgi:hypothetical protein
MKRDELISADAVRPKFYSVQAAAVTFGISYRQAKRHIASGTWPSVLLDRRRLIPAVWLDAFINRLETTG